MIDGEFRDGYLKALADVQAYCEAMKESFRAAGWQRLPSETFPSEWFEGRAAGYEEIAIHAGNDIFFPDWAERNSKLEIDGQT